AISQAGICQPLDHDGLTRINLGVERELRSGNIDARQDWGFAGDYVNAIWLMLADQPKEYAMATGQTVLLADFCRLGPCVCRSRLERLRKKTTLRSTARPTSPYLCGDASKAKNELRWAPIVRLEELIEMMVAADLKRIGADRGRSRP